jgi:proline iminopeptidase
MTPDQYTIAESFLDVGDGHQLYIHDWGNPKAKKPIIFLHGGPGMGCDNRDKQKFDPKLQRVIFHDQRGAGKSLPLSSLAHNTTQDLIDDIVKLVRQLKIKQFVLTGGSWGSCLALAYSIAHPEQVAGMVINGVFTASRREQDWLYKGGFRSFFPEIWQQYLDDTPKKYHDNPTAYHFQQAFSSDGEAVKKSAYVYQTMELALLKLDDQYKIGDFGTYDPVQILTEMHFGSHDWFMPEDYILRNAHKLTMPIYMVQGRYDMICPPFGTYALQQAVPQGQLVWSINGHLGQHESRNLQYLLLQRLTEGP